MNRPSRSNGSGAALSPPAAPMEGDRLWFGGAMLVGTALFLFNAADLFSLVDDAYISFRYLDNLIAGHGLVFNLGERVEGYTNFLWIIAMLPLRWIGLSAENAGLVLSSMSCLALAWAVYSTARDLADSPQAGWTALLLLLGSPTMARWLSAGMEPIFFALLIALGNRELARRRRLHPRSAISFSLAVLARPSGALHGCIAFTVAAFRPAFWKEGAYRKSLLWGLLFLALPLGHMLLRLAYYGDPLPNTFYAKLTGDLPALLSQGWHYVWRFFLSGGSLLFLSALALPLLAPRKAGWIHAVLGIQIVAQLAYVTYIGGDYFPYHRFIAPVVPALAILGGHGLVAGLSRWRLRGRWVVATAAALALAQSVMGYVSIERRSSHQIRIARAERKLVARWLSRNFAANTLLAVNAAGVIPYRTGMRTIDMLGLTNRHIARSHARSGGSLDGFSFVGHFKHDGDYVCRRRPDVVVTSDGKLHRGRSAAEAEMQAALNTFISDREFLRSPECRSRYTARSEMLLPGRYAVVFVKRKGPDPEAGAQSQPTTAKAWFLRGLEWMRAAQIRQAIAAFERSLKLKPGHRAALVNLAFCHHDLRRYQKARALFSQLLAKDPRFYDALYGLALTERALGNEARAIELFRRYVREAPVSSWRKRARRALQLLGAGTD